jgi:outer membrane protein OmpA-like peptidoglycan-associated protein
MIEARGWGEANPVAPNETDEDRNLNRRVEIIIRR